MFHILMSHSCLLLFSHYYSPTMKQWRSGTVCFRLRWPLPRAAVREGRPGELLWVFAAMSVGVAGELKTASNCEARNLCPSPLPAGTSSIDWPPVVQLLVLRPFVVCRRLIGQGETEEDENGHWSYHLKAENTYYCGYAILTH